MTIIHSDLRIHRSQVDLQALAFENPLELHMLQQLRRTSCEAGLASATAELELVGVTS